MPEGYPITAPRDALERARPLLAGTLLLASDFDGTLATPALDPWQTAIVPAAEMALRQLARTAGVHVALISGRTVTDLAARAIVGGAIYLGDHGAQRAVARLTFEGGSLPVEHEVAPSHVAAMAETLRREVPRLVEAPWLVLEDKGAALTFHFRAAPDIESARQAVAAAIDAVDPGRVLHRAGGRRAQELRPPGATTKAVALARLIDELRPATVLMMGDDRHDNGAMDVLRSARAAHRIDGLAIGVDGPVALLDEVAAHADLVLAGPDDVAVFLGLLADAMRGMDGPSAHDG
jgi:trehalose-phosphatase